MKAVVVAITGASGSVYAVRLLKVLVAAGRNVHLTISPSGAQVLQHETGLKIDLDNFELKQLIPDCDERRPVEPQSANPDLLEPSPSSIGDDNAVSGSSITYHHYQDFTAGIASGSYLTAGMVICPCSMGTLGAVVNGLSSNLIHRAADVHLKERRKLIVVPRETPLGIVQLDNMKRLAEAGAVILPAMPGFYQQPNSIDDLVDFVVGRICDQLQIEHRLLDRWGN